MSSLYLSHFGLTRPPFSITPDPTFFFEGTDRGVFISGLLHATLQAEGIVVVIGEVGSGKTLMSRILLSRLPKYVDTVYLPNPAFSRDEIIEVIARDLGVDGTTPGHGLRLEALQQELIKRHEQSRHVVVLIDEAHAMPTDSIEEVRRLSNLETDNSKLVQLILCGQPELDTIMEAPHLRQVRDRVVYRLNLRSLSKEDSHAYLDHRLRVAGWRGTRMFSWYAERLLLNDAKGRARRINILADKALLAAYADNKKQVHAKHVRMAIRDAGANFDFSGTGRRKWGLIAAWMVSITVAIALSMWIGYSLRQNPDTDPPLALQADATTNPTPSQTPVPPAPEAADATVAKEPVTQDDAIILAPLPAAPARQEPDETIVQDKPQSETIDALVSQGHAYAQQQSPLGHYAVRLASLATAEAAQAFIENNATLLPPEQIAVRRFHYGQQTESQKTRYVIYFGSFPTYEAANMAIANLPKKLHKDNPTIRTWKEISDAPWSLQ